MARTSEEVRQSVSVRVPASAEADGSEAAGRAEGRHQWTSERRARHRGDR